MAIKIRKKVDNVDATQNSAEVLEPEVLPPEGKNTGDGVDSEKLNVQIPGMEDDFLRKSGSIMGWIIEHRRAVFGILGVALIIALTVIGVQRSRERASEEVSSVLTDAFIAYTAMTKAEAELSEAQQIEYMKQHEISGDTSNILRANYTVPDERTRYVGITNYLSEKLPTLGDETVATSGQLMLAGSIARINVAEAAEASYLKAAASQDKNISLFGKLGEIETFVGEKKLDDALNLIEELSNDNSYASLYSFLLLEKARILEMKGNTADAIENYTKVLGVNRKQDEQIALNRLRILTPDWSERYQKVQLEQLQTAQAAAQNAQAE